MTETHYAYYPVFSAIDRSEQDPAELAHEIDVLFKELGDRLTVRGAYSTAGFREDADSFSTWPSTSGSVEPTA